MIFTFWIRNYLLSSVNLLSWILTISYFFTIMWFGAWYGIFPAVLLIILNLILPFNLMYTDIMNWKNIVRDVVVNKGHANKAQAADAAIDAVEQIYPNLNSIAVIFLRKLVDTTWKQK